MSYSVEGMLDGRQLEARQATHEDLFLQLYNDLLSWAMYLTDRQRERAEDLVHDSFIQFTRTRPDLSNIKDARSYLFRVVRNMHLSQLRRWLQPSYASLSISDFDSAEAGLRAVAVETDYAARQLEDVKLRVLSDLRHVCHYACARKDISKAGSVMILRFFHGYYPSEISRILRTTRKAVEEWLRIARREVKAHQSDPLRLRFMAWNSEVDVPSLHPTLSAEEIVAQLRSAVFHTCRGDCLASEQLRRLYQADGDASVECRVLAHIVSCAVCLDRVNDLLGIDPLSKRCPIEKLGRDRGSSSGGAQADGIKEFKRKNAKRAREYDEHRPHELRIVVNGRVLGAQTVLYDQSEQVVTVNLNERMSFIEVFSEQDVRLLYLDAESLPGECAPSQRVELSDGRRLDLALSFEDAWPTLRVSYKDPSLCPSLAPALNDEVQSRLEAQRAVPRRMSTAPAFTLMHDPPSIRGLRAWSRLFSPGRLTAALAIALIAALLWANRPVPSVSAAALLERATIAEDLVKNRRDEAINQIMILEERDPADGRVLARRHIETWRRGSDGSTARRLYDGDKNLIAGAWTEPDGTRKVCRKGSRAEEQTGSTLGDLLVSEELWQLDLTAGSFASIVAAGHADDAQVRETASSYVITYEPAARLIDRESPQLVRAALTLNRPDLHATEQTLLVQGLSRAPSSEAREYRFIEASYRRRSIAAVPGSAFEPEPELIGLAAPRSLPTVIETPGPSLVSAAPTDAELTSLEMEARYLLDQAGASLGEQISFTRTPDGRVRIEALVDTDERKAELRQALEPITRNRAVTIDLATIAEATKRAGRNAPGRPVVVTRFELGRSQMPAQQDLELHFRKHLGSGASDAEVERQVQRFATMMQARADQPMKHAWALKHLVEDFTKSQLEAMDPAALEQWRRMISRHARDLRAETESLRRALEPVFGEAAGTQQPGEVAETEMGDTRAGEARGVEEVVRSVQRLFELVSATERVVSKAFSRSVDNQAASASLKAEQFWRSLSKTEALAERLDRLAK